MHTFHLYKTTNASILINRSLHCQDKQDIILIVGSYLIVLLYYHSLYLSLK